MYVRSLWRVGEKCVAGLRRYVFREVLVRPVAFFDGHAPGELASRVSVELAAARSAFTDNLRCACRTERGAVYKP